MLELITVLSAVLGKYSDLSVVSALLVINAVLSVTQQHRAAGVVEALRRRLQVNARVRRESTWQVVPARELVPGDIVRVRPGDIIPADVRLLTGALTVDQSALTGGINRRRQGVRRRAVVGFCRPPWRGERCRHADGDEDLLWPHHRARRAGGRQGLMLPLAASCEFRPCLQPQTFILLITSM